jgi:hypothetical protein
MLASVLCDAPSGLLIAYCPTDAVAVTWKPKIPYMTCPDRDNGTSMCTAATSTENRSTPYRPQALPFLLTGAELLA